MKQMTLILSVGLFTLSMLAGQALAEETDSIKEVKNAHVERGKLRLHLDMPMAEWTYTHSEGDEWDGSRSKNTNNQFSLGPDAGEIYMGLGYRVSERVVVGTNFELMTNYSKSKWQNTMGSAAGGNWTTYDSQGFGFGIMPYAEYVLLDGPVQLFGLVTAGYEGYQGESENVREPDPDDPLEDGETLKATTKQKFHSFVGGAGVGAHFFLGKYCSLDTTLLAKYRFTKYDIEDNYYGSSRDHDQDTHRVGAAFHVGISGWF